MKKFSNNDNNLKLSTQFLNFLKKNETKSLFKPVRYKFPRRKVKAYFPFQTAMCDTINMRHSGPQNKNYKYIMVFIDVFSKMGYVSPMRRMNEIAAVEAMQNIFDKLPIIPQNIVTDRGTEFYNSKMKGLFTQLDINHYSLRGPHKAANAERFIRTIKEKLEKHFWATKSHKWITVLPDIIKKYNNSFHRAIKMSPNEVTDENRSLVFKRLYPKRSKHSKPRLAIGDLVRVRKSKHIFEKGYTRNWSLEIYKVIDARIEQNVDFYRIADLEGHVTREYKYFWELNRIAKHDSKFLESTERE